MCHLLNTACQVLLLPGVDEWNASDFAEVHPYWVVQRGQVVFGFRPDLFLALQVPLGGLGERFELVASCVGEAGEDGGLLGVNLDCFRLGVVLDMGFVWWDRILGIQADDPVVGVVELRQVGVGGVLFALGGKFGHGLSWVAIPGGWKPGR